MGHFTSAFIFLGTSTWGTSPSLTWDLTWLDLGHYLHGGDLTLLKWDIVAFGTLPLVGHHCWDIT